MRSGYVYDVQERYKYSVQGASARVGAFTISLFFPSKVFLQKLKTSKPPSMTGFQRFLTSNYRVNEYIEYTGGIFTWKNQQL